jgi:hypothetical protein
MATVYAVFANEFFYGGPGEAVPDNPYDSVTVDGYTLNYDAQGYYVQTAIGASAPSLDYVYDTELSGYLVRLSGGFSGGVYLYEKTVFQGVYSTPPAEVAGQINPPDYGATYWYPEQVYIPLEAGVTISPSDKNETAAIPLAWKSAPPGLALQDVEITQPQTGVIHFTDTDPTALPFATIVGTPNITATDLKGHSVTLTQSELTLLQKAFTYSPEAGNTNNGAIDWTFNYSGGVGDLDFLAGRTVTVTNTVKVTDQSGNPDTATVTNTLSLPATGIDYRYQTAADPLSASGISNTFKFVGEYLGGNPTLGYLSFSKAQAYTNAGLSIFSIYETAGGNNPNHFTESQGYADGLAAMKNAEKVHQTPGSPIYFAVDYAPGSDLSGVIAYFEGVNQAFDSTGVAEYAVGVYGGGSILTAIKDTIDPNTGSTLATYGWLAESPGYTGSRSYTNWNLEQIYDPTLAPGSDSIHTYFPSLPVGPASLVYVARDLTNPNLPSGTWSTLTTVGTAAEGYLSGATVFFDQNNDGHLDPTDVATTTGAKGAFTLTWENAPLVVFGGIDTSTGLPFKGQLTAPSDYIAITPLTTLVEGLAQNGESNAEAQVLASLNLSSSLDLSTLDPIAAAKGGDAAGAAAYVAGAKVYDTVEIIAMALSGVGVSFSKAYADTFATLDSSINALPVGQTLNLADQATINSLISSLSHTENVNLTSAATVAAAIAASNAELDHALGQDGASATLLADVANDQKMVLAPQPTVAADVAELSSHGSLLVNTANGVLAIDADPVPNDTLTVVAVNSEAGNVGHAVAGTYGTLILNPDGSYSYAVGGASLPPDNVGEDIFSYTAQDGLGGTATTSLTIFVLKPGMKYFGGTANATVGGDNGNDVLDGSLGHDAVIAGPGNQVLIGGPGDILTGGNGPNTFVFLPSFGQNTINQFNVQLDAIQLPKSEFADFTTVQSHMQQNGANTVIAHDANDIITLVGVNEMSLHAANFAFV